MRVSANGGQPEVLVAVKPPEAVDSIQILDGGKVLLYSLTAEGGPDRWDKAQIVMQSLLSPERKIVFRGGSAARYVTTGHLLYSLAGTLLAIPFDTKKLEVRGGPVPVIEGVMRPPNMQVNSGANFAFSSNGSLVYIPSAMGQGAQQTVVAMADRSGKSRSLGLPARPYLHPRISPDGKQLVVGTDDGKEAIVWVYDLKGDSPPRRLTFDGRNEYPIWSPDGRYITFESDREGDRALFQQPADGNGSAQRLAKVDEGFLRGPQTWSPDGKTLVFDGRTKESVLERLWTLSPDTEPKPKLLLGKPTGGQAITHAAFSPDGRWLAYMSQELGDNQVFVQPLPFTGAKYQISTEASRAPVWSPDGRQMIYHNQRLDRLVVVEIKTEPTFSVGKPVTLPIEGTVNPRAAERNYDIGPDGKQFAVILPASPSTTNPTRQPPPQINIVLNWFSELQQRVPVK